MHQWRCRCRCILKVYLIWGAHFTVCYPYYYVRKWLPSVATRNWLLISQNGCQWQPGNCYCYPCSWIPLLSGGYKFGTCWDKVLCHGIKTPLFLEQNTSFLLRVWKSWISLVSYSKLFTIMSFCTPLCSKHIYTGNVCYIYYKTQQPQKRQYFSFRTFGVCVSDKLLSR